VAGGRALLLEVVGGARVDVHVVEGDIALGVGGAVAHVDVIAAVVDHPEAVDGAREGLAAALAGLLDAEVHALDLVRERGCRCRRGVRGVGRGAVGGHGGE
jgi:hypothetical protein